MAKQNEPQAGAAIERLITQFRASFDHTVPLQIIHAFVIVARNEGKSLTELAERLGANMSTASRHLLDLGERNRRREPGYGLVEAKADPMNLRQKQYTLTPKGKFVWNNICAQLELFENVDLPR